jgi:Gamma-glutamyl cyclotransferase, AIG2-like
MFQEVWERVVGAPHRHERASLFGFVARRVRGEIFPSLAASDVADCTRGLVYFDLDDDTLLRLDDFETDFYRRISVTAMLESGRAVAAQTYIVAEGHQSALDDAHWDAERFQREHLAEFLQSYRGWAKS